MSDMDLREYRQHCEKKHGKKSINESMLSTMEKGTGGRKMGRDKWDAMHVDMKVKGAANGDQDRR